ncbi:MAG: TetR family transcriptional regulator C-terminal domain-containing protein [Desulfatiglandales bacterium]
MKESTKARILEAGAEIIHLKGFNHTGIQEILSAAGVPKGSFYNYFRNKEDFGLQIIDHFSAQFAFLAKTILEDGKLPPLERIKRVLDWFMDFFQSKDYSYGCPVGNLAQEMGDLSPSFRDKLKGAIDLMAESYLSVIEEAQASGDVSKALDMKGAAYFIVASWHGALIRMKLVKSLEPLKNHSKFVFDCILRP